MFFRDRTIDLEVISFDGGKDHKSSRKDVVCSNLANLPQQGRIRVFLPVATSIPLTQIKDQILL